MKAKYLVFLFVILGAFKMAHSQIGLLSKYSALVLPDSLSKTASAIYRVDEGILEINSPSKYTLKVHKVVTLLNREAGHHFIHKLAYDKFNKVEEVEIKIYNAVGKIVKKYSKKDFETRSYNDYVSDARLLYLECASISFPCTVESSYEYTNTSYIELPDWYLGFPGEAVESSKYTVKVAEGLDIRYLASGNDLKPEIKSEAGFKIYTWKAKDIAPVIVEENSYETSSISLRIRVSPQVFEYDGYKGEMISWQSFGAWNYQFYEDNKGFNKAQTAEILKVVANCKSDKEKVKVLYDRLKKSMRYVSIQLGIGGFKPFPIQYVQEKQYGDCKALTNYMRYMLKTVGIKSYPALINAGSDKTPADPAFPEQVFNHVILCVPLQKDTIWLECTSSNNEYGVLGTFTENKNALLLTEKGGILIATPGSDYTKNLLTTKTTINLNEEGSSKAEANIFCSGDFWDLFYIMMRQNNDDQKNLLINYLHYRMPEEFQFVAKGEKEDGKLFDLNLKFDRFYDFKAGSKVFLSPRMYKLCSEDLRPVERRRDYLFDFPYQKRDTTIINLPAGTSVENLPSAKEISNPYLHYKNEVLKSEAGNVITIISEISIKKQVIPPKAYFELSNLIKTVNQNEKEKIVLNLKKI